MRRLAVTLAALSLLAFAAGAAIAMAARGGPPPFPNIPGNWSHAEINVKIARQPHTLILDRGRIVSASDTQVTLRELGTPTTIPLSSATMITFRSLSIQSADLRRGLYAETMRIDGGAAVRVRETLRP
jgi:hypothetical protein